MKKNIVILGSTGSIGLNTLKIIRKHKKKYSIKLLSTHKNLIKVISQAKEFHVKHVIITNHKKFIFAKKKFKFLKINFYNSFLDLNKILDFKKIDYSMVAISGLDGLIPTINLIKYSKNIAIANKESIICGWNLIKRELIKYKTNFIPIDSEHFSIYSLLKMESLKNIDKIFITASGGPFLKSSKDCILNAKVSDALKHPNWKMGKKISIDSSTLMNKVFEVIEAKKIFDIPFDKIEILIHPKSYIHAIVKFKSGVIKLLMHEPDMKIPICNSLLDLNKNNIFDKFKFRNLDLSILNNLNLKPLDQNKFPLTKILNKLPKKNSLFETIVVSINDYFVEKLLKNEISYKDLLNSIEYFINHKIFNKYKKIYPKSVDQIYNTKKNVNLLLDNLVYKKVSYV
jgi:1-deoxy-D-xylulose-5-phosphate reductoisomerase